MSSTVRQIVFWVLILLGAVMLYKAFSNNQGAPENIDVGTLMTKIRAHEVGKLTIKETEVIAVDANNSSKLWRAESSNPEFRAS